MKRLIFILTICCCFNVNGQKEYAKNIMATLCSPFFAGRGYVNDGVDKAASFLIKELKQNNISSFPGRSYAQNYTFDVNTFPNKIALLLGDDSLKAGDDYILDPNSGKTVGEFIPMVITSANYQERLKAAAKGINYRTVLVFDSRDISNKDSLNQFMGMAYQANSLMPVIWLTNKKLMYGVGRRLYKHAFIQLLGKNYKSSNTIRIAIEPHFSKGFENKNVIGYIPGRKKNKYIVITGHYDHLGQMGQAIFPGANDNASGTAMLLSLAKYYSQVKPKYSLVFIFFSGEEAGLEGSKYFVQHPFFGLDQIRFLLNIDILGSASEGITAVNGSVHKKYFKLLTKLNKKGSYLPKVKPRGLTRNSDHYYFSQTGVPSFFVYAMGDCKNYHDIYDTAENTSLDNFDETLALFKRFIDKL